MSGKKVKLKCVRLKGQTEKCPVKVSTEMCLEKRSYGNVPGIETILTQFSQSICFFQNNCTPDTPKPAFRVNIALIGTYFGFQVKFLEQYLYWLWFSLRRIFWFGSDLNVLVIGRSGYKFSFFWPNFAPNFQKSSSRYLYMYGVHWYYVM